MRKQKRRKKRSNSNVQVAKLGLLTAIISLLTAIIQLLDMD